MSDAVLDQIEAARKQARNRMAEALGIPAVDGPYREEEKSLAVEMLDQLQGQSRCKHLVHRPVQPAYWTALGRWQCWKCHGDTSETLMGMSRDIPPLGFIEEFTCDRCRHYTGKPLSLVVCRYNFWTMILGCCDRCLEVFKEDGAQEVGNR